MRQGDIFDSRDELWQMALFEQVYLVNHHCQTYPQCNADFYVNDNCSVSKANFFFAQSVLSWHYCKSTSKLSYVDFTRKSKIHKAIARNLTKKVKVIWLDKSRQVNANWPTECFWPKLVLCIVKLTLNVDLYNCFSKTKYFFPAKAVLSRWLLWHYCK